MELVDLLRAEIERGASDLIIAAGVPPCLRIDGELRAMERSDPLTPAECRRIVYGVLTEHQKARFEAEKELDFSQSVATRDHCLPRVDGSISQEHNGSGGWDYPEEMQELGSASSRFILCAACRLYAQSPPQPYEPAG